MRIRVPSPTPSVGSDAPIPETLEDDPIMPQIPPGAGAGQFYETPSQAAKATLWTIFVGNVHPRAEKAELYRLFEPFGGLHDVVIRTTRGCGITPIPKKLMVSNDRCYATVYFLDFKCFSGALKAYEKKGPVLHGLTITVGKCPIDLPDVGEILQRTLGSPRSKKSGRKRRLKGIKKSKRRQITVERTELVIENKPKPQVGPSRRSARPNLRHTPLAK